MFSLFRYLAAALCLHHELLYLIWNTPIVLYHNRNYTMLLLPLSATCILISLFGIAAFRYLAAALCLRHELLHLIWIAAIFLSNVNSAYEFYRASADPAYRRDFKTRPLLDVLRRTPKNELEKSKYIEICIPRPLSCTYDYMIRVNLLRVNPPAPTQPIGFVGERRGGGGEPRA